MSRTIPRGWTEIEVKDFLKFTPREVEKPKERYLSLGIRSHFKGTFIREVENPDKVMMESLYEVKKDDLIVNITFAWEGAVALVKESDEGALVSHRFPTYVFDRKIVIPDFFRYLIPSKRLAYNLGVISPGGAGRNRVLDKNDFLDLQFIMPPVPEQKKIAEILSTWDRAVEELGKLIDAKTHLKRGLMQKLLSGNIRFNGFKGDKWHSVMIRDCCDILDNKRKPLNRRERSQMRGDVPYYGANGLVDHINDYIFDEELILMAEDGGYFDEFYTRPIAYLISGKSWVNNHAHVLKAKRGFCQRLIFHSLVHKNISKYLSSGTRAKLNQSELEKIEMILPNNLDEQKRVSDVLTSLYREINLMTDFRNKLMGQKNGLMQKLLTGKIRVSNGK